MAKTSIKVILVIIGIILVISFFLFDLVDRTSYQDTEYYQNSIQKLAEKSPHASHGDTVKVGWSKVSITPDAPVPLAGFGKRRGKDYVAIHDSVFVRTFVFEQGDRKAAYVTVDLLIFPPLVYDRVLSYLQKSPFSSTNLFFTATHTHSSVGGWQTGIVGKLFSGSFDEEIVQFLASRIVKSIAEAQKNTEKATFGFSAIEAGNLVTNRLVGDQKGAIDPWFRYIIMEKESGEVGIITNYAAHATCFGASSFSLTADYPGEVVRQLESDSTIHFAAFGAGAMGSMRPLIPKMSYEERIQYLATAIVPQVLLLKSLTPKSYLTHMSTDRLEVPLRDSQFRITKNIRLRPWVFSKVFGEVKATISGLALGNTLLIGTPADFSGELVADIEQKYRSMGVNIMVHSFNGSYMGYITKDEWYDLDTYETRTMNWFGHENGAYFTELIEKFGQILIPQE